MTRRLRGSLFPLIMSLAACVGCQSTSGTRNNETFARLGPTSAGTTAAPEPERGGLLRTGSIMLGPGVGRNSWRWQGDGQWGF